MAQGQAKIKSKKKSKGSQKRRSQSTKKKLTKGTKSFQSKRSTEFQKANDKLTKDIDRKNLAITSARAISNGGKFFLSDVKESGNTEIKKQRKDLLKKESNRNDFMKNMIGALKKTR